MKIRTFRYFSRQALQGMRRNGLMSLAAVGTITVALLVFGLFFLLTSNMRYLGELAKGKIEIKAFLAREEVNRTEIEKRLLSISGVKEVEFVSKEEGAKTLSRLLGDGDYFVDEENPLPDSFNIYPVDGMEAERIAQEVQRLPGVEEVVYGQNFVRFIKLTVRLIWGVGLVLLFLIMLAVLYIVTNTIQLTVYARRKEIEIMKLVGATDWFIRWPFLLEGIFFGLMASILSAFLLIQGYVFLYRKTKGVAAVFPLLQKGQIAPDLVIYLLAMGIFFGAIGSLLSVKKHLKD